MLFYLPSKQIGGTNFMNYKLRIILEKVELKTNKVISKNKMAEYEIKKPDSIIDLGLRHKTQIELLKKIQQHLLEEQSLLISPALEHCSQCGSEMAKNGYKQSNFHAVFSDHKLKIQRHICPICNENEVPSIKSLFGTSIHPDLYKLQSESDYPRQSRWLDEYDTLKGCWFCYKIST